MTTWLTCTALALDDDGEATLGKLGGPRCGDKATYHTPMGPRCDTCAWSLREALSDPRTTLNILTGRVRTPDEIARMFQPIGPPASAEVN